MLSFFATCLLAIFSPFSPTWRASFQAKVFPTSVNSVSASPLVFPEKRQNSCVQKSVQGRSVGSFPKQWLVIEPTTSETLGRIGYKLSPKSLCQKLVPIPLVSGMGNCGLWWSQWWQGSYRSWKTWKVMKFKNLIFQAWKVMEFNWRSWKFMENWSIMFGRLVTVDVKARTK